MAVKCTCAPVRFALAPNNTTATATATRQSQIHPPTKDSHTQDRSDGLRTSLCLQRNLKTRFTCSRFSTCFFSFLVDSSCSIGHPPNCLSCDLPERCPPLVLWNPLLPVVFTTRRQIPPKQPHQRQQQQEAAPPNAIPFVGVAKTTMTRTT